MQSSRRNKQVDEIKEKNLEVKALSDDEIQALIEKVDLENFSITIDELKEDIKELAPTGARTYLELKEQATETFKTSLKTIEFINVDSEKFVLEDDNVDVQLTKKIAVEPKELSRALFDYSFIYGNYTRKRKWIKVGKKGTYFCLPKLLKQGNHSALVILNASKIADKLQVVDNALIRILARSRIIVPREKRMFCFSKGHLLSDEHRLVIMNDLAIIFDQIKKTVDRRDFSELQFFHH